mmetsp:Transcript_33217/g.93213  ORF Transcript_33217/g.93213 Transcript_33217/m.93213 type:complete len:200 (+) Transcript_33217:259-858(+)
METSMMRCHQQPGTSMPSPRTRPSSRIRTASPRGGARCLAMAVTRATRSSRASFGERPDGSGQVAGSSRWRWSQTLSSSPRAWRAGAPPLPPPGRAAPPVASRRWSSAGPPRRPSGTSRPAARPRPCDTRQRCARWPSSRCPKPSLSSRWAGQNQAHSRLRWPVSPGMICGQTTRFSGSLLNVLWTQPHPTLLPQSCRQ